MQDRLIQPVERVTERNVLAFISNPTSAPNIEIELFLLTPTENSAANLHDTSRRS
jgi:hypothetical protein